MINTAEIRIGNFVDFEGECCKVLEISKNGLALCLSDGEQEWIDGFQLYPIPLTEEIILDFGFFKYNNAYVLEVPDENIHNWQFSIWNDFTYNSVEFPVELKYLHQLQNLYFALTNKELCYKS